MCQSHPSCSASPKKPHSHLQLAWGCILGSFREGDRLPDTSVQPQALKLGSVCTHKVSPQLAFAFDVDQPSALTGIS